MKNILDAFLFALSYFSIIPVPTKNIEIKDETYKYTLLFLPLVGAILGFLVVGTNLFLNQLFNPIYSCFVSAVLYLFLYGFLHLEAVCDASDVPLTARRFFVAFVCCLKLPSIGGHFIPPSTCAH